MPDKDIILIGAPVDSGKDRRGCLMGPDAYRTAGIAEALSDLGHRVSDRGNLSPAATPPIHFPCIAPGSSRLRTGHRGPTTPSLDGIAAKYAIFEGTAHPRRARARPTGPKRPPRAPRHQDTQVQADSIQHALNNTHHTLSIRDPQGT